MASNSWFHLPDEPFFTRLVWLASQDNGDILNDRDRHVKVDYATLLRDILAFRQKIRDTLPHDIFDSNGMVSKEGVYICLLVSASYESLLGVFAVASLGAAVALMPNVASREQALYFLNLCGAPCLLTRPGEEALAAEIQDHAHNHGNQAQILPITRSSEDQTFPPPSALVRPGLVFPDLHPGLLLFTSGTTNAPQGVIHSRRYLSSLAQLPPRVGMGEVHMCLGSIIAWTSGFHQIISSLLRGVRVEIYQSTQRTDLIWEFLREGEITTVCFPVKTWWDLRRHYQEEISRLAPDQVQEYIRGVQHLRTPQLTGGMLPPVLKQFWNDLLGQPVVVCFGSTETGLTFLASPQESSSLEANIGTPAPGVTVKLSEGDHGELWVKKNTLFLGYMGKETPELFDEQGFFRTGDIVHRQGNSYIWDGRAKHDFVDVNGSNVPIRNVEYKLLELPYVDEGYILPVPDDKHVNQVAALVRFRGETQDNKDPTLDTLRKDLSRMMPPSHLPTLLRVLPDGYEVQRTWTGKVAVGQTIQKYFM